MAVRMRSVGKAARIGCAMPLLVSPCALPLPLPFCLEALCARLTCSSDDGERGELPLGLSPLLPLRGHVVSRLEMHGCRMDRG